MAVEIERKFTVVEFDPLGSKGIPLVQAYISETTRSVTRVRITDHGSRLTIKSKSGGMSRHEFEYAISDSTAHDLLELKIGQVITKTRYFVKHEGLAWDVDVFGGPLTGLILAEVELTSESQCITLPPFVDTEVTGQKEYFNYQLSLKGLPS